MVIDSVKAIPSNPLQLIKKSAFIFQLRLDFRSFVIAGPSTVTTTVTKIINGQINSGVATGPAVSLQTQCLTDTFSVTGPSGSVPPVICGTNTGEHSKIILKVMVAAQSVV